MREEKGEVTYMTGFGYPECGSDWDNLVDFLRDFSLGGGRGAVLGLVLSGERARLRVAVVEALRS